MRKLVIGLIVVIATASVGFSPSFADTPKPPPPPKPTTTGKAPSPPSNPGNTFGGVAGESMDRGHGSTIE